MSQSPVASARVGRWGVLPPDFRDNSGGGPSLCGIHIFESDLLGAPQAIRSGFLLSCDIDLSVDFGHSDPCDCRQDVNFLPLLSSSHTTELTGTDPPDGQLLASNAKGRHCRSEYFASFLSLSANERSIPSFSATSLLCAAAGKGKGKCFLLWAPPPHRRCCFRRQFGNIWHKRLSFNTAEYLASDGMQVFR